MKTREELDALSFEEIEEFRYEFLTKSSMTKDRIQFYNELEFYTAVRFKNKEEERFNRWADDVKEAEKKGPIPKNDLDLGAKKLVTSIGFVRHYNLGLAHDLHKIKEFKFIKDIPYELPDDFKKITFNSKT